MYGSQGPPKGVWGTWGGVSGPSGAISATFLKSRFFRILRFFSDSRFFKNLTKSEKSTSQKSCQKSAPMAQKHPQGAPNTFRGSLEPIHNFWAIFLNFWDFHLFYSLNSVIFKYSWKPFFFAQIRLKVVKPVQNRLEITWGCPRDTLETHSTLPQRILCRENGILQKTRFCVYFSTFLPRWVPSKPDLDILQERDYFSVLLILLNYLKGT